jgi:hypothetical protein
LDESLRVYAEYLDKLGLSWGDRDLPEVAVEPLQWEGIPGIYDPATNRIVLAPDAVEDVSIALRQYTHWVLTSYRDQSYAHGRMTEIQDGLADYLPCSHLDDPLFGRRAAQRLGAPVYRDLAVPLNFDALPTPLPAQNRPEAGAAWGSLFWAIRSVIGPDKTDAILAESWVTANTGKAKARDRRFLAEALNRTPPDARAAVDDLLEKRGVSR